ncbi:hypothetical protein AOXY_G587 [Acipenser oxyrinchus oxyrinchus]|uniref:Uncharacterized protein n=1 Tax=Acipenser oxyrinchus oxyrinchus TaxID=40147 RepID=A0AAD8GK60_ACIOX|nr:hypothetical protein AOXY_G587 [Acipenser oxyrinchus oxyrinchus]
MARKKDCSLHMSPDSNDLNNLRFRYSQFEDCEGLQQNMKITRSQTFKLELQVSHNKNNPHPAGVHHPEGTCIPQFPEFPESAGPPSRRDMHTPVP